ncbi:MAG: tyrosine-type recombinase/integrase [Rhodospirillales bacterium]|nr:tyrosine-type recombinase/integrase [Rhodospirillales bacterium]
MSRSVLRQARVDGLRPRYKPYTIRDSKLRGFGVRVAPSGRKRFFLHVQHAGERLWRDCGDAASVPVDDARTHAASLLTALRSEDDAPSLAFEVVAEEVFRRYGRRWKPRTMAVNRSYYRNQLLPWFRGRPIGSISAHDVQAWFASLRSTPSAADRAAPVLSVIFRQAELYGYRPDGSNPCRGIRRYRRRGRERFMTPAELRRLGAALDAHAKRRPSTATALRLILLTGCRKSEIIDLEWDSYREGKLFLRDSKTGPRTVWLSAPARELLDLLPRTGRRVFPGPRGGRRTFDPDWRVVRSVAGLHDVRLHDCRHTYASIAMQQGESIRTIGLLLGHRLPATTLKYVHLADDMAGEAVERVAPILGSGH